MAGTIAPIYCCEEHLCPRNLHRISRPSFRSSLGKEQVEILPALQSLFLEKSAQQDLFKKLSGSSVPQLSSYPIAVYYFCMIVESDAIVLVNGVPNKTKVNRLACSVQTFSFPVDLTTMTAPSSDGIGIANLPNQVCSIYCISFECRVDQNCLSSSDTKLLPSMVPILP